MPRQRSFGVGMCTDLSARRGQVANAPVHWSQ